VSSSIRLIHSIRVGSSRSIFIFCLVEFVFESCLIFLGEGSKDNHINSGFKLVYRCPCLCLTPHVLSEWMVEVCREYKVLPCSLGWFDIYVSLSIR
jgi:hypothetical protein